MDYILPETNLMQIKTMEKLGNNGLFVIEPLSPGYGLTIGNSLRRVLLSSLEGAAISWVKIDGVTHEFATIPGVREDAVEIILNLKTLRFRLEGNDPVNLNLSVKGPKEVTAADFNKNANCEIVNKDTFIASLSKGNTLNIEIHVEHGRGYVPVERRREDKLPLGTIAVDSIFTPVKKVHYEVENTRVGGMTNFDKVTFEITTDGSVDPEIALKTAAGILVEHFSLVQQAFTEETAKPKKDKTESKEEVEEEPVAEAKKAKKTTKKTAK